MSNTIAAIEALESAYASDIALISDQAEVRSLGGNLFAIVDAPDYGTVQFVATYSVEDLGLPADPADANVWLVTVRDQVADDEILFEATSPNLVALVASAAAFMGEASAS